MPTALARHVLAAIAPPLCLLCRVRLARPASGPAICSACAAEIERTPPRALAADGIDGGLAALPYDGAGRSLVRALKFSRLLVAAELGAALIAERSPPGLLAGSIVPVPAAPLRLACRGFDPATELARRLAAITGLEVDSLLARRDLRRQRGSARGQRLERPPRVRSRRGAPSSVVLVDDVTTTGATIDVCARALREAGAERITAMALAAVEAPRRGVVCRPGIDVE